MDSLVRTAGQAQLLDEIVLWQDRKLQYFRWDWPCMAGGSESPQMVANVLDRALRSMSRREQLPSAVGCQLRRLILESYAVAAPGVGFWIERLEAELSRAHFIVTLDDGFGDEGVSTRELERRLSMGFKIAKWSKEWIRRKEEVLRSVPEIQRAWGLAIQELEQADASFIPHSIWGFAEKQKVAISTLVEFADSLRTDHITEQEQPSGMWYVWAQHWARRVTTGTMEWFGRDSVAIWVVVMLCLVAFGTILFALSLSLDVSVRPNVDADFFAVVSSTMTSIAGTYCIIIPLLQGKENPVSSARGKLAFNISVPVSVAMSIVAMIAQLFSEGASIMLVYVSTLLQIVATMLWIMSSSNKISTLEAENDFLEGELETLRR